MSSDRIGLDQALVARKVNEAELAAVAFLDRYSGRTLEAYRQDLRFFFAWTRVSWTRSARSDTPAHRAVPSSHGTTRARGVDD